MRERVFVDTSALYALADGRDDNHARARAAYTSLLERHTQFVLTDHVLAETATLIRRRLGYDAARRFLQLIEAGEGTGLFSIAWPNRERFARARELFDQIQDPKLSLMDTLSFSAMEGLGLKRCFAFDEHFQQAGFKPVA